MTPHYSASMRRSLVALGVGTIAVALIGSAAGAERFKRHAIPGQRISLTAPASWVAVDATLSPATIARLSRENPKLAPYLGQLSGSNSAAKFVALDPAVQSGFATNVNVVVAPIPTVTFDQFRTAIVNEIASLVGLARIGQRTITIDGVRGVRLSYPFRITVGRSYTVATLQYAFQRPGTSVVLTYTTLPRLKSRYAPTFARSAASIRFG